MHYDEISLFMTNMNVDKSLIFYSYQTEVLSFISTI